MILSMTGYGVAASKAGQVEINLQVKSVNSRYLDIFIRFPNVPVDFEQAIRDRIKSHLQRGRVDLFVEVRHSTGDIPTLNSEAAARHLAQLRHLNSILDLAGEIRLPDLLGLPGVWENSKQDLLAEEFVQQEIIRLLDEALRQLLAMRQREGENLTVVIEERLAEIEADLDSLKAQQAEVGRVYTEKLRARVSELLEGTMPLDESRLAQEVAYLADRAEIAEEIDRFYSHLRQFRETVAQGGATGKKLDFIVQEMNREVNTILSKTEIPEISRHGIAIKSNLEKIREQVQNIE